jgi:hypothetical protein
LHHWVELMHEQLVFGEEFKVLDIRGKIVHGLVPDKVTDQLLHVVSLD